MPLSEDEQRILDEIEHQFRADDPHLADEMGTSALYSYWVRRLRLAGVLFAAGAVVLVATLSTAAAFGFAVAGVVMMLVATLWFERTLAKLGRSGMERLTRSLRPSDRAGTTFGDRIRGRLHQPESHPNDQE